MLTLHLPDEFPQRMLSNERPSVDDNELYHWLAWVRDLLDLDGAYVKIWGRESCLDLNHAGFWFLYHLDYTLDRLLDPSDNNVIMSFPRQGEEVEISHLRIDANTFHVKTYDGMTWKPNFGGDPYETKVLHDKVHSLREIFTIYFKSYHLFIEKGHIVDDAAMHQPCMIAWQQKIDKLLNQGLNQG